MQELLNDQGILLYDPDFLALEESRGLFQKLRSELCWRQDTITLFGKTHPLPRLQAFYGDSGVSYTYSRIALEALDWTPDLAALRARLEHQLAASFQGVLCNLYRHGLDYAAWHSDNEPELGPRPLIASLSLGETRRFALRHRHDRAKKLALDLAPGSLLVMKGELQQHWLHQLVKTRKKCEERINLTFRPVLKES